MPYIPSDRRVALFDCLSTPKTAGELNYQLTCVLQNYVRGHGASYATFNDISGAMTECLAEFRRRVIAPYEDTKIQENGDVY